MKERIAVIEGVRSPMGRMGGKLRSVGAEFLGAHVVGEIYKRLEDYGEIPSEVIIGNVAQPAHAANIARVISIYANVPEAVPAYTVHRNCASGIEAITSAACKILAGKADTIIAGGTESMSNIPLLFRTEFKDFLEGLMRSKTPISKIRQILKFRLKYLKPVIGLKVGLTDPTCNLIMGDTAEILAQEFGITREQQDRFAMLSHNKAEKATKDGVLAEEILPIPYNLSKGKILEHDEGVRNGQNMEALAKLRPFFDRRNGTVTAGNSSQITDGAAAVSLMSESRAKKLKIKPLGYIKDFYFAGLDPSRMGLGPAYAIAKLVENTKIKLKDVDFVEINEAFAAQVLACQKALDSKKFCTEKLGLKDKIGAIETKKLNVHGGAVALGHPVGMTGTRIVLHLLKHLERTKKQKAIASLCIGGGQGAAVLLERN